MYLWTCIRVRIIVWKADKAKESRDCCKLHNPIGVGAAADTGNLQY